MKKLLAVVNPKAGARSGLAVLERARPVLERGGWSLLIRQTERAGHAIELAHQAATAGSADAIAAVGGDGTLHEVVNGLAGLAPKQRLPVVPIPAGSGNSLSSDLGTGDPLQAVARLVAGARRAIDLCRLDLDGRTLWSINVIGWGAVVRINQRAERLRWAVGARYTLAAALEIFKPDLGDAGASVNGESPRDWLFGTASISQHTGKGMRIAPRARLDDGKVDLVRIRRGPRLQLAKLLSAIFDGQHADSALVDYAQVERFELEFPEASQLLVDGELVSARRIAVTVVPRALELLA